MAMSVPESSVVLDMPLSMMTPSACSCWATSYLCPPACFLSVRCHISIWQPLQQRCTGSKNPLSTCTGASSVDIFCVAG